MFCEANVSKIVVPIYKCPIKGSGKCLTVWIGEGYKISSVINFPDVNTIIIPDFNLSI